MKKKLFALGLSVILGAAALTGCGGGSGTDSESNAGGGGAEAKKIVIGASTSPHAEILGVVKEVLAAEGYELEIREFTDYLQMNPAVDSKDLDANFFQHKPFLDNFNAEKGTSLVSAGFVHYEPLGLYPGKTATIDALADGAEIAVPNDTTNEARALLLLEAQGLIKINPDAGINATKNDITENPKNLKISEIDAAQNPRVLQDVDMAVINGNFALAAGLNVESDALAKEEKDSLAATTYANIVAVRSGDESREEIAALMKALQSEEVRTFIDGKYEGAVVPMF